MTNLILTPAEVGQFQDALLSAFNRSGLEQLVYIRLGEDLDQIVEDGSLAKVVLDLVKWANQQGKAEVLLRAARSENPGNSELRAFDEQIQSRLVNPPAPPTPAAPPAPVTSPLTPALRLELVEAVLQLPVASDYAGRSGFLQGVPAAVTRSNDPRTDLNTMFDQLNRLGRLVSGEWPLLVVIDNILPFTTGWQAHDVVQRIRQTLAQAYGA